MPSDPFNLNRFIEAQRGTYDQALAEIRLGAKRTHWMWFIFPQLAGLGTSPIAQHYAIRSLREAVSYLRHPTLGTRYTECVAALDGLNDATAATIFGPIDALKLRSSLTLFARAGRRPACDAILQRWFAGPDPRTIALLGQ